MNSRVAFVTLLVAALLASASTVLAAHPRELSCDIQPSGAAPRVTLEPVASGLTAPLYVTHAGDGSGRLFVVEKNGLVRIVDEGQVLAEPFLDLSDLIVTAGEQGLLSVAFHPNYADNGRFFVYYSGQGEPRSVVAEYRVSDNPNRANPEGKVILAVPQPPTRVHKAGQLEFGPDGYLYIALGDGGASGHSQDLKSLLGKILRIDIDAGEPYSIPSDNPFFDVAAARGEIWAYGFRNPWRFSFDMCTERLFVGDVGAARYEEIDVVEPGKNYGWAVMEADECTDLGRSTERCDEAGFAKPVHAYAHLAIDPTGGQSVIGGYVYRGEAFPALAGRYVFADLVSGRIWTLTATLPGAATLEAQDGTGRIRPLTETKTSYWTRDEVAQRAGSSFVSFGEGEDGELYLVSINSGTLERVVADPTAP